VESPRACIPAKALPARFPALVGVYHHVSHEHLPMYLAEFDFRYNARSVLGVSDPERTGKLLKGIVGKRLTYRRPDETAHT